ncbi:MAG TPA: flippase activity-associated protein Agl23 [Ktedonobacteraceae bacterium]|nr:flippase activity-associated protein Agl23 [Ktedonobacteraceae bacterium]
MKSFEAEPIGEVTAQDLASDEHEKVVLSTLSSNKSANRSEEMSTDPSVVDSDLVVYEEDEEDEKPQRRKFASPTRQQLLTWIPFLGVILLGAVLRFWGLGDKPLHHDESLHAYYSLQLLNNMAHWTWCINPPPQGYTCYTYTPLLHGPFQFHFIALVYKISQLLGAPDNGVNTTTVRILAATLVTAIVALPFFLRDYLGNVGAWLACLMLAVSPSMVYFSRFAREDIYMAFFTLLMVVGVARYVHTRKMIWLVIAAAAFSFSYATKEATFLTILVFGSFLGALIAWELGVKVELRSRFHQESRIVSWLPKTFAPIAVLIYFVLAGIAAKFLFAWIKSVSLYITDPNNVNAANDYVQHLKNITVAIVPVIGILLGAFVLLLLYREIKGKVTVGKRNRLAQKVDPGRQPLLDTILTMPWTHWFFALLCAWVIFLLLFSVMLTNISGGIGDGVWQGLYYWLQQQQVARGNQPWYYYLMLIPLYEQIGVVFGLLGIIRCLAQPTRFRLFMVYWFIGNFVLYSWAAEKMPWLMIHITMPMLILAAIGLEPAIVTCINFAKRLFAHLSSSKNAVAENTHENLGQGYPAAQPKIGVFAIAISFLGVIMAVLLLLPTLHNMYEVAYVHPADGPHEMMVYVQTTTDVNTVMAKVDALDQKMFGGNHQMQIGLTSDATWPYAWYLRDYPNVCFDFPTGCPGWKNVPVIIGGGDNPYALEQQYGGAANNPDKYSYQLYKMRTWWDEGYKPPATGGVGPGLWLSYGDNPPVGAKFNLGLAAQHIWQWWWQRRAIGDTGGAYDMVLFIRNGLTSAVKP